MNDIEPWLNGDAPADVAESLLAARAEAPRRVALERCIAMLGAAGAVGLSASAASSASYGAGKSAGFAVLVKWGLSGVAAGALLVGGVEIARNVTSPPPAPVIAAPSVALPKLPSAVPAPVFTAPSPGPSAAEPRLEQRSAPKVAEVPSDDERLAAELRLLNDVRAAVDRRDTDSALRLLAEHDRRYGADGELRPEARYLRLEALERAGRLEEARGVARRILELDPRGPHAARAKEVLEKE